MQHLYAPRDEGKSERHSMSSLFDVGRICVKIAGRDAGKKCVVVEVLEKGNVLVDGETRRRAVNIKHLEPLNETIELSSSAEHNEVAAALKKMGLEVHSTKAKAKSVKPVRMRKGGSAAKVTELKKQKERTQKKTTKKKESAGEAKNG